MRNVLVPKTGSGNEIRGLGSGLYRSGSVAAFRAAAPLPIDTQRVIDQAVISVGRQRLQFVEDLLAAGLTYPLPNWLAVPTLYQEKLGEAGTAKRTMQPKSRGQRFVLDRAGYTLPIYCTWDDFSFGIRELLAAERVGAPLDTSHVAQATRNVNEALEDAAINGGITVDGNSSPGLVNAPDVNTYQYLGGATGRAWDDAAKTGAHILADLIDMIEVEQADNKYGPYNLYVPLTYGNKLMEDYSTSFASGTIRQRLLEIDVLSNIRVVDYMPADRVALVQMTSDVVDIVVGQTPTEVSWEDGPGWERSFVVLACMVPRFKSDYSGQSGIVLGNIT
jgi:hypothetical protein